MILGNFIPLLASFFASDMTEIWFFPLLALAVVATVPCIVKQLLR